MESQGESMEKIVTLFVESSKIGANRAKGIEACRGTEAAGDFLFDLWHAHDLLGDIIGEGNTMILETSVDRLIGYLTS